MIIADDASDYVSPDEDRLLGEGYLLEVNRRFFHPLGLHLFGRLRDEPPCELRIADCRHDPEGVCYLPDDHAAYAMRRMRKIARIEEEWRTRARCRRRARGWVRQPPEALRELRLLH